MINITNYLENILVDFNEYVQSRECLCELKNLNFSSGNLPDYEDENIQQLYSLRYAFAYAFEYKHIFKILLRERDNFEDDISILSIGCGTYIDYWALVEALKSQDLESIKVDYLGVDLIDWKYKMISRKKDNLVFRKENVINVLNEMETIDNNVIIFPKSISEFASADFNIICDIFESKPITSDKFHILISLRADEHSSDHDMVRTELLVKSLKINNFSTKDRFDMYTYFIDEKKGIKGHDQSFTYPDEAIDLINGLNKECESYIREGQNCEAECKTNLNRWPILTVSMIKYQILTFDRKV